jgi:hypothetical protein
MSSPGMEVTLVKAAWPGDRDRAWLTVAGVTRRGPVHVVHDLLHLAVESLFGIDDGLWAELAAGDHLAAGHAATARGPKRQKRGRIVSGAATGARTGEWLTPGHRRAKTITNCVANRWGDGPDTATGVRDRAARQNDPSLQDLLARVDDQTIAMAVSQQLTAGTSRRPLRCGVRSRVRPLGQAPSNASRIVPRVPHSLRAWRDVPVTANPGGCRKSLCTISRGPTTVTSFAPTREPGPSTPFAAGQWRRIRFGR